MSATDDPDLLFGYQAIANHLGITPRQVQHQVSRDEIPSFKVGGRVCATRSGLARHFAEKMQRVGAPA